MASPGNQHCASCIVAFLPMMSYVVGMRIGIYELKTIPPVCPLSFPIPGQMFGHSRRRVGPIPGLPWVWRSPSGSPWVWVWG